MELEFRMLGPLEVWRGESRVVIAPGRPRALLGLLVVHLGEVVSVDRLLHELWQGGPPASAAHALQVYVSSLRKLLEPERRPGRSAQVLVTRAPGYTLEGPPDCCDARRFEGLAAEGSRALEEGRPLDALRALDKALCLWRGPVLADLADEPFVQAVATRFEEMRLDATEARFEAQLALGRHAEVIAALEDSVGRYPFRERLWGQLMVALYRSGRQAEALGAFQRLRRLLGEELGLEPSPELRRLEAAVLRHDPDLAAPAGASVFDEGDSGAQSEPTRPLPSFLTELGPVFVGRQQELERLGQSWEEAGAGQLRLASPAWARPG